MYFLIIALWIIINGRITGEILFFGIFLGVVVSVFAQRVIGYAPENDRRIARNLPLLLLYVAVLIKEIIKAAVAVSALALGRKKPEPVIVEFDSGFKSRLQNTLLANSITLTPGTITVFLEGDHFVVHCLMPEYGKDIENSVFVKLLRKMKI